LRRPRPPPRRRPAPLQTARQKLTGPPPAGSGPALLLDDFPN
jgi:hypothetical protein